MNETSIPVAEDTVDFKIVFEALPGRSVLIKTDSPAFTILAITEEILQLKTPTLIKNDLIGKKFFEAFPQDSGYANFIGKNDLRKSFDHVIAHKEQHHLPAFHNNLLNGGDGTLKYWSVNNKPVFDSKGSVIYILAKYHLSYLNMSRAFSFFQHFFCNSICKANEYACIGFFLIYHSGLCFWRYAHYNCTIINIYNFSPACSMAYETNKVLICRFWWHNFNIVR